MKPFFYAVLFLSLALPGCGPSGTPLRGGIPGRYQDMDSRELPPPAPARTAKVRSSVLPPPPPSARVRAQKAEPDTVIVKRGDTVYAISRKYEVPVREIIAQNRLSAPFLLQPEQKLILPGKAYHIVKEKETIYGISRRYTIDMHLLAKQNNIGPPYLLKPGEKLLLPSSYALPEPPAPKARNKPPTQAIAAPAKKAAPKKPAVLADPPKRASSKSFGWPLKGNILLKFGSGTKGMHNDGINIAAKEGESVKSAENGIVAYVGNELKGFGNLVLIKHEGGWMTAYAHLSETKAEKDKKVARGQEIGKAGTTGHADTPQLHFEIRRGTKAVNPLIYLR